MSIKKIIPVILVLCSLFFIPMCSSLSKIQVLTRVQFLPIHMNRQNEVMISGADVALYEISSKDSSKKVLVKKEKGFENMFVLSNSSVDKTRRNNRFELVISKKGYVTRRLNIEDFSYFTEFPRNKKHPFQVVIKVQLDKR
ncbi:MAG: hypothetical protein GY754_00515 [bacterium]|nr:hypothetical protein [bacterium]